MAAKTVLVGFDGAAHARRAMLRAAELAGDGRLIVVIVLEPSEAIGARIEDVEPERHARLRDLHADADSLLEGTGAAVEIEARVGNPAEEIVRVGEARNADLIAVGRSQSRPRLLLHRTVWDQVVRGATIPVLVVP